MTRLKKWNWPALLLGLAFVFVVSAWVSIELDFNPFSNSSRLVDDEYEEELDDQSDDELVFADDDSDWVELAKATMDELAAHEDDPQKPTNVPSVPDEDISAMSLTDVAEILEACKPVAMQLEDEPRYLFQLGRTAMPHCLDDEATGLFTEAASRGSAAAYGHLALLADTAEEAVSHLQNAINGGFEPAKKWVEELGEGVTEEVAADSIASRSEVDFSIFRRPDLMKSLHDHEFSVLNSDRYLSHAYVTSLLNQLNDNTLLFFLDDEAQAELLRLHDRAAAKIFAAKAATDTELIKDKVVFALDAVSEAASGFEKAAQSNADLEQGFRQTVSPFMVRMAEPEAIAEQAKQDAIQLAKLISTRPKMAKKIFSGLRRFVVEYH